MDENKNLLAIHNQSNKGDDMIRVREDNWRKEKIEMQKEISILREKEEVYQRIYDDSLHLMREKMKILDDEVQQLKHLKDTINKRNKLKEKVMNDLKDWMEGKSEMDSITIKEQLLKSFKQLKDNLIQEKSMHKKELNALNEAYQEKLEQMNERKEIAERYVESLKKQIGIMKKQIEKSGDLFEKTMAKARISIEFVAKESAAKEIKSTIIEMEKLKEELLREKKKAIEKERKLTADYSANIKTLYKLLNDKNDIITQIKKWNEELLGAQMINVEDNSNEKKVSRLKEETNKISMLFNKHEKVLEETKRNMKVIIDDTALFAEAIESESKGNLVFNIS